MGAYVEDKFDGGFILDEGKLRKVVDLIESRIGDTSLIYKVYRGDSYSYETSVIEDVINEDNEDWRAITKLQLLVKRTGSLEFSLTFYEAVSIYITGDNRDSVFLIYSDLREYINNEVISRSPISGKTSQTISFIFLIAVMAILFFILGESISKRGASSIQAALEATDIIEKIDFLIKDREMPASNKVIYLMIPMTLVVIFWNSGALNKLWSFIFPTNLFLFGEKKRKYEARMGIISKVFWGVGVALVVSTIAGFFVWKLTS